MVYGHSILWYARLLKNWVGKCDDERGKDMAPLHNQMNKEGKNPITPTLTVFIRSHCY